MENKTKKQVRKEFMDKIENLDDLERLKYINKYIELLIKKIEG